MISPILRSAVSHNIIWLPEEGPSFLESQGLSSALCRVHQKEGSCVCWGSGGRSLKCSYSVYLLWFSCLGYLFVCFFKVTEENGEQMPCYFVRVNLQEVGGVETKNWTVPRRLSEFQNLHRKLSEVRLLMNMDPWSQGVEFPRMKTFKSSHHS